MFRHLVLIKHWFLNQSVRQCCSGQLVPVPWEANNTKQKNYWWLLHHQPTTTRRFLSWSHFSLAPVVAGGTQPWSSGSLKVFKTFHLNSGGSTLCFSFWCLIIKPLLFFSCSLPRVNRFLSDSPMYLESAHFRHFASYNILFLRQIFPPPAPPVWEQIKHFGSPHSSEPVGLTLK